MAHSYAAQELVEARQLIEVELAGFAAERATADDRGQLQNHLNRMETSLKDVTIFQEADIAFHLAVGQAGHNRILQNALQLIRNLMQESIGETLTLEGVAAVVIEQERIHLCGVSFTVSTKIAYPPVPEL
jgi:GntR family transcriptional regulator, transcriptional repressor for pyruvate dehydrogenase complex